MCNASTFTSDEIAEALDWYINWWKKWVEMKKYYIENLLKITNKWPRNIKY
jgi:hypothetical protein